MTGTTMGTGGSAGVDVSISFPGGGSGISLDTMRAARLPRQVLQGGTVYVLETFSVHCSADPNCFSQISVVSTDRRPSQYGRASPNTLSRQLSLYWVPAC